MNFIAKCPRCGSEDIDPVIENEVSYYYCNNCGLRSKLNNQDGGAITTTASPGIEFVVPPGSTETDIELIQTLNELSTQTSENQRFDNDAQPELERALYGNNNQTGSGNKPKKYKRKKRKYKRKTHICRNKSKRKRRRKLRGGKIRKNKRISRRKVSRRRVSRKKKSKS